MFSGYTFSKMYIHKSYIPAYLWVDKTILVTLPKQMFFVFESLCNFNFPVVFIGSKSTYWVSQM